MAYIKKIKLPSGQVYDIYDAGALRSSDLEQAKIAIKSEILGSAPEELNTLEELAAALGSDENFSTTILNLIGSQEETFNKKIAEVESNNSAVVITKNGESRLLDTFNVIKLTKEEYNELVNGNLLDPDALYLTEGEEEQVYSKVIMTEGGTTKTLEELHIVKLSQEEYDAMMEAGTNDPDTLYMTEAGNAEGATQVIMTDGGIATELEEFNIIKITESEYQALKEAGALDPNAFYWTEENYLIDEDEDNNAGNLVYQKNSATLTNLIISDTTASTSTSSGALIVAGGVGVSGDIYANNVFGAVWNDYAEYRRSDCKEPGRVIVENGDDTMSLSEKRLQYGAKVISDTFGFAIGETEKARTPIAVSGRVLVYPYENRNEFRMHIGRPVCSGPNGTVSLMSDTEEKEFPSAIIGYISAVPDYEYWEDTEVKINDRIWIYVR